MSVFKPIAKRIAQTDWMQNALQGDDDPDLFRKKPSRRVYLGIGLMLLSYVIGWPAVGLLGGIAYHMKAPLILVIGGPLTYGLSHLVFLAGLYLAGKNYAAALARRALRKVMARFSA